MQPFIKFHNSATLPYDFRLPHLLQWGVLPTVQDSGVWRGAFAIYWPVCNVRTPYWVRCLLNSLICLAAQHIKCPSPNLCSSGSNNVDNLSFSSNYTCHNLQPWYHALDDRRQSRGQGESTFGDLPISVEPTGVCDGQVDLDALIDNLAEFEQGQERHAHESAAMGKQAMKPYVIKQHTQFKSCVDTLHLYGEYQCSAFMFKNCSDTVI
jgi:hypothetical protein